MSHARAGRHGAAAEGRRPVRVRARRRGGAAAARGGDRLRGRPRGDRGHGGAGLRGHPRHPPRARHRRRARDRAHARRRRGRRPHGRARLPRAGGVPGNAGLLHGGARAAGDRGRAAAAGRPADEPAAVVEAGTLPRQRTVAATLGTIAEAVEEAEVKPPSITVVGPVAALARRAVVAPAAAAVRQERRRDAGARAGERARARAEPSWARASWRRRRSASAPLPGPPLDPSRLRPDLRDERQRRRRDVRAARGVASRRWMRARSQARASRRSARAPPRRCSRTGSVPTWCPSAPSPRALVEALDRRLRRAPGDAAR